MSQWSGSVLLLLCSHHGDIVYSVLLRVLFDHFAFALIKIFSGIVFVVRICANFGNLGTCLVFQDYGLRWSSEQIRFRTHWSRHFIPTAVSTKSLSHLMQHWIGWWSLDCRVLFWMKAGRVDCSCFNTSVQLSHLSISVLYGSSIQLR